MLNMMDDLISRQAAIDALHTWFRDGFDEDKWWNSTHVLSAIEGLPSVQQEHKWETCFDCPLSHGCPKIKGCTNEQAIEYASQIPNDCPLSAQPERDIPIKPNETTDTAWGIPLRQAVCPKCDYYLGHVAFLGDYKGKKVTYCETCGQAIDWEGWDSE